jgi:Tfp pilus assembly protein PilW
MKRSSLRSRGAFTLVEMMMAIGLSLLVILGIVAGTVYVRRVCWRQSMFTGRTQNLRTAVDMLTRDMRMAGYGLRMPDSRLSQWIGWVAGVTNVVQVTPGADAETPDEITVVSAYGQAPSKLQNATSVGDTAIVLTSASGFSVADTPVVLVGKLELVRVISVAGNTLTISASTTNAAKGLLYAYPAGSPVEPVRVITYSCETGTGSLAGKKFLSRNDHTSATAAMASRLVAVDIENLKATATGDFIGIQVTGRTPGQDPNWDDPVKHDGYRRKAMSVEIQWRNR